MALLDHLPARRGRRSGARAHRSDDLLQQKLHKIRCAARCEIARCLRRRRPGRRM
jgi:hypothetical protein